MEIKISDFVRNAEPFSFSASQAERGENVARETWRNACEEGEESPVLTTEGQLDAMRAFAGGFGAWRREEIAAWSATECNALFIQFVSGDLREAESLCPGETDEGIDWDEYERLSQEGTISGRMFRGIDGEVYYTLE